MRTAEDIVNDYTERGYDSFRIRAIATLRPEPMRGDILALLDNVSGIADEPEEMEAITTCLETPSTILAALKPDGEDLLAPVDALFDTMPAAQAIAEEISMIQEEETEALATNDYHEEIIGGFVELDDDDEMPEVEMCSVDTVKAIDTDDSTEDCEEHEEVDPFWDICSGVFEDEEFEPVSQEKVNKMLDHSALPGFKGGALLSPVSWSELRAVFRQQQLTFMQYAADTVIAFPLMPVVSLEASLLKEDSDRMNEVDVLADISAEQCLTAEDLSIADEAVTVMEEFCPIVGVHLVDHELDDQGDADDAEEDSKVLYAFSEEDQDNNFGSDLVTASPVFELVGSTKADNEWVDCGSGLIILPKSMTDSFNAYSAAINREPLIIESNDSPSVADSISMEELVTAIEQGEAKLETIMGIETVVAELGAETVTDSVNDAFCEDSGEVVTTSTKQQFTLDLGMETRLVQEPVAYHSSVLDSDGAVDDQDVSGLLWPTSGPKTAAVAINMIEGPRPADGAGDSAELAGLFEEELGRLENHLTQVETVVTIKDNELKELRQLVLAKDEILSVQQVQLEEERSRRAELDAEMVELSAKEECLRSMTHELAALRVQLAEAECERNILKTDTVPALEDQQLSLVNLLEEEVQRAERAELHGRSHKRRMMASSALAVAAGVLALLSPMLGFGVGAGVETAMEAIPQIAMVTESQAEKEVYRLKASISQLESEKVALHEAGLKLKADKQRREGILLSQYKALKTKMEQDKLTLVAALNRREQASQNWNAAPGIISPEGALQPRVKPVGQQTAVAVVTQSAPSAQTRGRVRVVKSGESFSEIVREYYGTANRKLQKRVAKANGINNTNQIYVGQEIKLVAMAPSDD